MKPTHLVQAGHQVLNPALDDDDFTLALRTAQTEYDRHLPDVIVGSSRGGAVALNIVSRETPLVLLCPAWKDGALIVLSKPTRSYCTVALTTSFLRRLRGTGFHSGLPSETLIEVGSDHRLADESSLAVMLWACELLASGKQLPQLDSARSPESAIKSGSSSVSQVEGSYICDGCGEEIVIPLDVSEGQSQPISKTALFVAALMIIHVSIAADGTTEIWPSQSKTATN